MEKVKQNGRNGERRDTGTNINMGKREWEGRVGGGTASFKLTIAGAATGSTIACLYQ